MRAVSTATSAARHSLVALAEGILIAAILAALIMAFAPILKPADQLAGTGSAQAAKGGGGKGPNVASTTACSIDGSVVTGYGLPSDEVINFLITDSSGTWGWVLGFSDTGSWNVTVPAASGSTKYEFTSRQKGANGSKYTVFSGCTA